MGVGSVALACLLASLPGPPGTSFYEAYLQALPVSRAIKGCNTINPKLDVRFLLYTSENQIWEEYLEIGKDDLLRGSSFNVSRPTVIYLHGFLEGADALSGNVIKEAYMERGGHNVILVDYRRLAAGPWYTTAVSNSGPVGRYVARFVDYLVSRGMRLDSLHVVGMSLGAHIAGVVGRSVRSGQLPRITGLDPAGPNFDTLPTKRRLDKTCARFVDVIHTDGNVFGNKNPVAHADFYPNGGVGPQPGCQVRAVAARNGSPVETVFCSHWRSFQYYAESVTQDEAFPAVSCHSWRGYKSKECSRPKRQSPVYMGLSTTTQAHGTYFLRTKNRPPYAPNGSN